MKNWKYRYNPEHLTLHALGHQNGGYTHGANATGFNEGDVIVKVVAKVVRKPAEKKVKPFEVGKTYKSDINSNDRFTVLAILKDGTIVTRRQEATDGLAFLWKSDGSYFPSYAQEKLIPEYEEVPGGLTIEEIKE